jgi:WD40 repeat protein
MRHQGLARCTWVALLGVGLLPSPGRAQPPWPHFVLQSGRGLGQAMAFSPDGRTLATGDATGIALIDVATQREAAYWTGAAGYPRSLAFSPDGRWLAVACEGFAWVDATENAVQVWDVASGRELRRLRRHRAPVAAVAFTDGGRKLVSAGDNATVIEWDWQAGRVLRIVSHPTGADVGAVQLSADGRSLLEVSGTMYRSWWDGNEVKVYEASSKRVLRDVGWSLSNQRPGLVLSPDGRWLAVDGSVLDLAQPPPAATKGAGTLRPTWSGGTALAIDVSGLAVTAGLEGGLELRDLSSGALLKKVEGTGLFSAVFTADARRLAVRDGQHRIRFYDMPTMVAAGDVVAPGVPSWSEGGGSGPLPIAAYGPDGRLLAVADRTGDIGIWRTDTWRREGLLHGDCGSTPRVRFGPRGDTAVSFCSSGGYLQVWDLATRTVTGRLERATGSFDFTPDGAQVAWMRRSEPTPLLTFTDVRTATPIRSLPLAADDIRLTRDGKRVIGLLEESNYPMPGAMLRLAAWDAQTLAHQWHVVSGGDFAVSPDGAVVALGSFLFDAATGKQLRRYTSRNGFTGTLAFSADGRRLAAGYGSARAPAQTGDVIVIWDTKRWQEAAVLSGHEASVGWVEFSPDGRHLVSVGSDFTVRVWSLEGLGSR